MNATNEAAEFWAEQRLSFDEQNHEDMRRQFRRHFLISIDSGEAHMTVQNLLAKRRAIKQRSVSEPPTISEHLYLTAIAEVEVENNHQCEKRTVREFLCICAVYGQNC